RAAPAGERGPPGWGGSSALCAAPRRDRPLPDKSARATRAHREEQRAFLRPARTAPTIPRSPASLRRRLKLAHELGPVARQNLQPLPPRDRLAARATEARLVEVRPAACGLYEPRVPLPHL